MAYFITGGTGFIGGYVVKELLDNFSGPVYILVRKTSSGKAASLKAQFKQHQKRIIPIEGDLSESNLGIDTEHMNELHGKITHFFHLAALYDIQASFAQQKTANIAGTAHALDAAKAMGAGCFHHVSSIAAAGLYRGVFREDMFEEADHLDNPYFRAKHDSEALVRNEQELPWRIYRPAMVIGHSKTGHMTKIDGPYYLFKMIQAIRRKLPEWMPMIGIEGGFLNVVPVDYVARALTYIAHKDDLDQQCFHLTDTQSYRVSELMNIFLHAAHAPTFSMRIDARVTHFIPSFIRQSLVNTPPIQRWTKRILQQCHIPSELLPFFNYPTRFDCQNTQSALAGTDISPPSLPSYAGFIWDYWERRLDPDLFKDRSLHGSVKGKKVLITGGTSGIGKATATKLVESGAEVIIVARNPDNLRLTADELTPLGHPVSYYSCDISDTEATDQFILQLRKDHPYIDILINNAGRSIRRAVEHSYDRFHDFQRTMALNYFGSLHLTLGLLPAMAKAKQGHIINISSIGVLTNEPRFSAYVASKSALEAFSRCAANEYSHRNIHFTNISMPLVNTPMIAPTTLYHSVPTLTPEGAANLICEAILDKPKNVITRLGRFAQLVYLLSPTLSELVMNTEYNMFGDSAAAQHGSSIDSSHAQQNNRQGISLNRLGQEL